MMNNDVDLEGQGKWTMLPTKLLLHSELPVHLQAFGSAWEIVGQPQPLLKSAVQQGVNLTLPHLEKLQEILKFRLPARGSGSGKNGSVVKLDYAMSLVNLLHPDASQADKKSMIDSIMGKMISKVKCAPDIIKAVKELGAEGERDFSYVYDIALNQEAVEKERKTRGPTLEREEFKTFTPSSLKSLLPVGTNASCSRNPIFCRYQAFYPGSTDSFSK